MAVVQVTPIVPLSSSWTHERIVNEVRSLTNELDNERINNSSIRNHINAGIAFIADLLNTAQKPDYGIIWRANLESTVSPSGLDWIDLTTPLTVATSNNWERGFNQNDFVSANQMIPSSHLWGLSYVTAKAAASGQNNPANVFKGNCQLLSISEITTLNTGLNDQYRASICYVRHGSSILFHIGSQITAAANTAPDNTATYYERPKDFVIYGYRQPLLDNMLPESTSNSSFKKYVDVPDRHVRLLLLLAQKNVQEQLKKEVDAGLEQSIGVIIQQIQGAVQQDITQQVSERTKQKQGFSTR